MLSYIVAAVAGGVAPPGAPDVAACVGAATGAVVAVAADVATAVADAASSERTALGASILSVLIRRSKIGCIFGQSSERVTAWIPKTCDGSSDTSHSSRANEICCPEESVWTRD